MLDEIVLNLENKPIAIISEDELENLFNEVEIVKERDTYFRDKIRILQSDKIYLIQEKSNKDDIIIRKVESLDRGIDFINNRLKVYENMWNGCGCKIDYYK